jgi:phosphoenolpyruvate-protein kinase (PTS system EI component)
VKHLGSGVRVTSGSDVTGVAKLVDGIDAVLALMSEDVSDLILIVGEAGATGIAPILPDARGVICTSGGPTSHLALVAKEYGIPCVMAANFEQPPDSFDGADIVIGGDGTVSLASTSAT